MKKKISIFIAGITIGFIFFFILQHYKKFLVISTNEKILETTLTISSSILAVILSTTVAFLVASYQMKKEKENISYQIEKEKNIKNLRFLNVLKHECEINYDNIDRAVKISDSLDPEILLANLDNFFSMNSWDILYLEVDISEDCYNEISKLYRIFRKIKGTPAIEFRVIMLAELSKPLTSSIALIKSDIIDLNQKINKL